MWKNTFRCKICDRPMPPRVYEAHLKKSHTPEEVQTQVEKNETEIDSLVANLPDSTGKLENWEEYKERMQPKPVFDWGEVYPCATCGEEYPAKAMPFHSWVRHRV